MSGAVNKVILIGNLGAKPECKYLPSGQPVCEMRIATTETFKDRNDQPQERTEWHRVVVWGKTGENAAKYLDKGRQVYIEGKLQTRSWDGQDGKKQYMTEIVANTVVFLGGGGGGGNGARAGGSDRESAPAGGGTGTGSSASASSSAAASGPPSVDPGMLDDDIPF